MSAFGGGGGIQDRVKRERRKVWFLVFLLFCWDVFISGTGADAIASNKWISFFAANPFFFTRGKWQHCFVQHCDGFDPRRELLESRRLGTTTALAACTGPACLPTCRVSTLCFHAQPDESEDNTQHIPNPTSASQAGSGKWASILAGDVKCRKVHAAVVAVGLLLLLFVLL